MRKLEHPNVIKYREIFESGTKLYLVMELGGVGLDVLRDSSTGDFDETILKHMMRQLFDCLVYLQSQSISHHDIKASNLLYSSDGRLLLCDFGVAEEAGADGLCRCFYGTPTFQAPEIAGNVDGHPYDGYKADVWSAGILFFYMITGGYPYTAETVYLLLKAIEEDPVKLPNNLDPVLEDLLSRLLDKDPVTRISASEALQHPWFSQDQQVWESCCTLSKCSIS